MSVRNSGYERKPNDHYATPPWVTEALLPHLPRLHGGLIWEPAAGEGKMVEVLSSRLTCDVYASDVAPPIGLEAKVHAHNFLVDPPRFSPDAVITNPPYGKDAFPFIRRALDVTKPARGVVALLLRTQFDHAPLYRSVFRQHPAWSKKLMLTRRIVWFVEEATGKPKAGPSDCHAWFIWDWRHQGPATIAYGPDGMDEDVAPVRRELFDGVVA